MSCQRPPLKDIMCVTGLSRATVDRALNGRAGVRPATLRTVKAAVKTLRQATSLESIASYTGRFKNFSFVIQADEEFTQSLIEQTSALAGDLASRGCELEVIQCTRCCADRVAQVIAGQESSDGVAILVENSLAVVKAALALKLKGVPVVATNTDIELTARHSFVGIDNRAAGQSAGFIMGRHLCNQGNANVAVVVETHAYRCHEEREMGFRSVIRQRFPSINIIDVVSGRDGTYDSTKRLLKLWPEIDGIYNTSGGNHDLAQVLDEEERRGRTLFIGHEINGFAKRLIRTDAMDYLIAQNLRSLVIKTVDELLLISNGGEPSSIMSIRPELICKYTLPLWAE